MSEGLLKAALLGVIQGLTEFLPVSSTAHLLVCERLLGYSDPTGAFTVMIQLGSVLAVAWLYRARVWAVLRGLPSDPGARRIALGLVLAFLPAVLAGGLLAGYVKGVLYGSVRVIGWALVAGGAAMLLIERLRPTPSIREAEDVPPARALGVGVFQALALVPGVSRSGATVVGGLLLGLDGRAAAEYSFFLAMPTMTAAFAHDAWELRGALAPSQAGEIAAGFLAAFAVAALVVKPFLRAVSGRGFAPFAWYRVAAGAALLAAASRGWG